jgi:hypothetical protein
VKQVVEDEVATNSAGRVDRFRLGREEVADITKLEDKDGEPVMDC